MCIAVEVGQLCPAMLMSFLPSSVIDTQIEQMATIYLKANPQCCCLKLPDVSVDCVIPRLPLCWAVGFIRSGSCTIFRPKRPISLEASLYKALYYMEWLGQLCSVHKYVLHFYLPVIKMNKISSWERPQMYNKLKSVVEFHNLKNRPKFLCIKENERLLQSWSGSHVWFIICQLPMWNQTKVPVCHWAKVGEATGMASLVDCCPADFYGKKEHWLRGQKVPHLWRLPLTDFTR